MPGTAAARFAKTQLRWEPEFAVRLVQHLVYGSTIAEAAGGRMIDAIGREVELGALATLVRTAMIADLGPATEYGIAALEKKAALTSDCLTLLSALQPMADILRYGEARAGTAEHLGTLMPRIVVQAALALPYAARNLDAEAAAELRNAILAADGAVRLAQLEADVVTSWRDALRALLRRRRQELSPGRGRSRALAEARGARDRTPQSRSAAMSEADERSRRWTLALGVDAEENGAALSASDRRMSEALSALYGDGDDAPKKGRGGLGGSAPRVAKWLGDIREFFSAPVVQLIQKDAFERKGLRQMLLEPEFLATVEADVNLIADLVASAASCPRRPRRRRGS
jgi:Family of unknown function (DUF5682)